MGDKNIDRYIYMIQEKRYGEVIEGLMIKYYDPRYENNNKY